MSTPSDAPCQASHLLKPQHVSSKDTHSCPLIHLLLLRRGAWLDRAPLLQQERHPHRNKIEYHCCFRMPPRCSSPVQWTVSGPCAKRVGHVGAGGSAKACEAAPERRQETTRGQSGTWATCGRAWGQRRRMGRLGRLRALVVPRSCMGIDKACKSISEKNKR